MMNRKVLMSAVAAAVATAPQLAFAADTVAATASVYGVGDGSTAPDSIALGSTAQYLTFAVSGVISFNGGGNSNDADGVGSAQGSTIVGVNGLSGISSYNAGFLTGVFLTASGVAANTPATLAYANAAATAFTSANPLLNQVFFIGDGLTGDGVGLTQKFFVPTGATRLLLGFADAGGYNGTPGSYGDNTGSLSVASLIVSGAGAVPEPATWSMMTLGFGAMGFAMRRRSKFSATRILLA